MRTSNRDLKVFAKKALEGRYKVAIYSMLAVSGVTFLGSTLTNLLFQNSSTMTLITGNIFSFILAQIMNVFAAGMSYLYLNMSRGKEYSYSDLIYLFKHNPDRVLVASLVMSVIELVMSIPYYYVYYFTDPGTTLEEQAIWYLISTGWMMVAVILTMIITLPFCLTYYLLVDDLNLSGMDGLKLSLRLMKGNKWKYVRLMLSFIPWLIASLFTFYILLLWLVPYMEMTTVMFYRDVIQDFYQPETETIMEMEQISGPENVPEDEYSYDAEA